MKITLYKLLIILSFLASYSVSQGQVISINFEDIPNTVEVEGLKISDQYLLDFGITFELENGQSPTLAAVGSPVTAFLSSGGDDTPLGTNEIGTYFLTDDGLLSGLESSPLIIRFEDPISNAEGVILDIDFTESFTIEAFGIDGDLLFTTVVEDGDAGTGDGLATPWQIGTDFCFEIYSLRLAGQRTQAGEFGLGLDNFRFYPTVKILETIVTDSDCGSSNGSVEIVTNTSEDISFSIDGIEYFESPFFENLSSGDYTLFVMQNVNCIDETQVTVGQASPIDYSIKVFPSSCGVDDGIIDVTENPEAIIKLNDQIIQDFLITDLASGSYLISFEDVTGCIVESTVTVAVSDCPFYLPNIFSPNNDGINDKFYILTHPDFAGEFIEFIVYDRWGNAVFQALDFLASEMSWNGLLNNRPSQAGVYVYTLAFKNSKGSLNNLTGTIYLYR